ncbi:MAG TPA: hypothetical protein PLQ69_09760 [Paludibacter sp.]|nr:hypothetical protein [Paludibacter sp.]HPM11693.1 hypothetical protein [Paludibacter sp.]
MKIFELEMNTLYRATSTARGIIKKGEVFLLGTNSFGGKQLEYCGLNMVLVESHFPDIAKVEFERIDEEKL